MTLLLSAAVIPPLEPMVIRLGNKPAGTETNSVQLLLAPRPSTEYWPVAPSDVADCVRLMLMGLMASMSTVAATGCEEPLRAVKMRPQAAKSR